MAFLALDLIFFLNVFGALFQLFIELAGGTMAEKERWSKKRFYTNRVTHCYGHIRASCLFGCTNNV